MNTNKIALLAIAVVAIGIFALPSTVSLFAGQHVWYNLEDDGNQVPCEKCHAEIFEEYTMSSNGVHKMLAGGTGATSNTLGVSSDANLACGACHRINNSANPMTFASGDGTASTPGKEAHAAATIACMACHSATNESGTSNWWAPYAGGFMEMNSSSVISELGNKSIWQYAKSGHDGTAAAHNAFIVEALDDDTLQDSNEACIACHTNIAVKINWTHRTSLEWDVGLNDPVTTGSGVHNWTMSNWIVNGTAWADVYGNTTGAGNTTKTSDWPGEVGDIYTY